MNTKENRGTGNPNIILELEGSKEIVRNKNYP